MFYFSLTHLFHLYPFQMLCNNEDKNECTLFLNLVQFSIIPLPLSFTPQMKICEESDKVCLMTNKANLFCTHKFLLHWWSTPQKLCLERKLMRILICNNTLTLFTSKERWDFNFFFNRLKRSLYNFILFLLQRNHQKRYHFMGTHNA